MPSIHNSDFFKTTILRTTFNMFFILSSLYSHIFWMYASDVATYGEKTVDPSKCDLRQGDLERKNNRIFCIRVNMSQKAGKKPRSFFQFKWFEHK